MGFLDGVVKGKIVEPVSIIVYGPDGIGKTEFASEAPEPIFQGSEIGTSHLGNVARLPNQTSYANCLGAIKEMIAAPSVPFKTFVMDTIDWFEPMVWREVCLKHPKKPKEISDIGWQKGYERAITVVRSEYMEALTDLKQKHKMHLIFLAHGKVKTFQDPANTPYDRYNLGFQKDEMASIWRQYVDAVLFLNYDVFKEDAESRRAEGSGSRSMYTEERPAFHAKCRYPSMPFQIPMKKGEMWKTFYSYVERGQVPDTPAGLLIEIDTLMKAVPETYWTANAGMKEKITAYIETVKFDVPKLAEMKSKVKAIVGGVS